tara:strand:- start:1183 stop:1605 length:423 start_codon:yes stop_codon:yes gene_type:complete
MDDKPGIVVAAAKSAIDDAPRCRWCRRLSKVHFQRPFPKNAAVEKHFRIERDDDDDSDDDAGFPRALVVVLLIIAFVLVFPDVEAHRANRARCALWTTQLARFAIPDLASLHSPPLWGKDNVVIIVVVVSPSSSSSSKHV